MSRRLIERSIPLDAISAQSAREESIRHGHIFTLHIWWARRSLDDGAAAVVQGLERRLFGYGLGDGEELDFDTLYPSGHRPAGPVQEIPHSAWLVRPEVATQIAPSPPDVTPPELPPEQPPVRPEPPERPVQSSLAAPAGERRYRRVAIRAPVRWEDWQDFYNEVIGPLVREGADVSIHVELAAESESGIGENTVELGIRESLVQRGARPEIETEE